MGKRATVSVVMFALIMLPQGMVGTVHGEGSPVTCVVISNPTVSRVPSNYTVTVNPASARVIPGESAAFDVLVMSNDRVPTAISLDITGLPEGISAVFDPENGRTDFASKLTVSVDEMICPGVYAPSIVASDTNLQLAEFKLEVAGAGSVRETMESKIDDLGQKIDDLEGKIADLHDKLDDLERASGKHRYGIFAGFFAVLLVAIIGSFLLGAFALFVLMRHVKTRNAAPAAVSPVPPNNDPRLHMIIDLLRQLVQTSRRQSEITPESRSEIRKETDQGTKKEDVAEPNVGDVWYASCPICGLRTEHGRDYDGVYCARCGSRLH